MPNTYSVVIAAYKAEKTIAAAIESALNQTLQPEEIIVVDDGSPDRQQDVIARFGSRVEMVVLPSNQGVAAAKNTGVSRARGDFVALLDADDEWHPERLEAIERLAQQKPRLGIIATDAWVECEGRPRYRYYKHGFWPEGSLREGILRYNFIFCPAVRRHLWLQAGGMDESQKNAGDDWPLWVKLVLNDVEVGLVEEPLYAYRLRSGSLTTDQQLNARAKLLAMEAALSAGSLSRGEQRIAVEGLRQARSWVAFSDTFASLYEGQPYRRNATRLLFSRATPSRTRLRTLEALLTPNRARRRLREHPTQIPRA